MLYFLKLRIGFAKNINSIFKKNKNVKFFSLSLDHFMAFVLCFLKLINFSEICSLGSETLVRKEGKKFRKRFKSVKNCF